MSLNICSSISFSFKHFFLSYVILAENSVKEKIDHLETQSTETTIKQNTTFIIG